MVGDWKSKSPPAGRLPAGIPPLAGRLPGASGRQAGERPDENGEQLDTADVVSASMQLPRHFRASN